MAAGLGWRAEITGGNHLKFTKPECPAVYFGLTPSICYAPQLVRTKLRRAERGIVPWKRDQWPTGSRRRPVTVLEDRGVPPA
jgi:hypothetical protein